MADGHKCDNSATMTDFDEICMAMHLSRYDPIGDQKFENLIICGLWIVVILKIEKT